MPCWCFSSNRNLPLKDATTRFRANVRSATIATPGPSATWGSAWRWTLTPECPTPVWIPGLRFQLSRTAAQWTQRTPVIPILIRYCTCLEVLPPIFTRNTPHSILATWFRKRWLNLRTENEFPDFFPGTSAQRLLPRYGVPTRTDEPIRHQHFERKEENWNALKILQDEPEISLLDSLRIEFPAEGTCT